MTLKPAQALAVALDPSLLLSVQGLTPDPWQQEFLLSSSQQNALLLCTRGAGKSRAVSALAVHTALFRPGSLTLLISRAQRQALELFRYVKQGYLATGPAVEAVKQNETTLELANGSRVVALPGKEGNIRSFQGVDLVILDEAARVPDDLYATVRPMLAVSKGRLVAMSTPFGQRGWFWRAWKHGEGFHRVEVPWQQCPRITADVVEADRKELGEQWVQQEYECKFTALSGLVYPDFGKCIWDAAGIASGRLVGGIDFGWRNPFAAIWGALDSDDVLWIVDERYRRETPLHEHAAALMRVPGRAMTWYCDPSGATEIAELRAAGMTCLRGNNDIRAGIAAITARIQTGRLRINRSSCPNLIAEAELYRYPAPGERAVLGETPIDENNHALGALRYLVSRIDAKFLARFRRSDKTDLPPEATPEDTREKMEETARSVFGADWNDEDFWEHVT